MATEQQKIDAYNASVAALQNALARKTITENQFKTEVANHGKALGIKGFSSAGLGSSSLAEAVARAGNSTGTSVGMLKPNLTYNPPDLIAIKKLSKNELKILRFPTALEEKNLPYVLFKIFETQTGKTEGETTLSRQSFAGGVQDALDKAIIGSMAAGRLANGMTAGAAGVVANKAVDLVDAAANKLGVTDFVSQTKESLKNFSLSRNTEQLKRAIALFIPDGGVTASYDQNYNEISLTGTPGGLGMLAQAMAKTSGKLETVDSMVIEATASKIADMLPGIKSSQDLTNLLIFSTTGQAINPQLEILYGSPKLRTFTFDFRLIPKNANEAYTINEIISDFKFFSAPEIPAGSTGRYFIPPARFEIEFYHHDEPNTNLFKTKQCVLTNMSIDYAPNGYASHSDGAPVETRMQLVFQETTIIDRDAVSEGY